MLSSDGTGVGDIAWNTGVNMVTSLGESIPDLLKCGEATGQAAGDPNSTAMDWAKAGLQDGLRAVGIAGAVAGPASRGVNAAAKALGAEGTAAAGASAGSATAAEATAPAVANAEKALADAAKKAKECRPEAAPKLKSKERRAQQQAEAKKKKHGDPNYEEPASEDYAKWKAKEVEKARDKDARRASHDKKTDGIDRSKSQLDEDYE
jgi:hypothetical protein